MTLGPAAEPALPALDGMATGPLDGYARQQAKDAAAFIRQALTVEPDAPAAASGTARQRAAFLNGRRPSDADRSHVAEAGELLEHPDAYVRAAAADFLAKAAPAAGEAPGAVPLLEQLLAEDAAVEVGAAGRTEYQGRLYHWRRERRSPRVAAVRALFALDRVPTGDRILRAMLAESVHAAAVMGRCAVPQRFPIGQWRRAATAAGGLAVAEPRIRAARQQCRQRGGTGDQSAFAAELELAEVIRQLSGRLV